MIGGQFDDERRNYGGDVIGYGYYIEGCIEGMLIEMVVDEGCGQSWVVGLQFVEEYDDDG